MSNYEEVVSRCNKMSFLLGLATGGLSEVMSNQPWECPRCKRINAPFNPTCFCNAENHSNVFLAINDQQSEELKVI